MDAILQLFAGITKSLNVDSSIWIQLGIFLVTYFLLTQIVFKPYFKAIEAREKNTQGSTQDAEKTHAQTRELEALYQRKARSLSADIKEMYDKSRSEGASEFEKVIQAAREASKIEVENAREKILIESQKAKEEIQREAPELGRAIAARLLPKEVQL